MYTWDRVRVQLTVEKVKSDEHLRTKKTIVNKKIWQHLPYKVMFIEPANKRQHDGCQQNANEMVNTMVNTMVANENM